MEDEYGPKILKKQEDETVYPDQLRKKKVNKEAEN